MATVFVVFYYLAGTMNLSPVKKTVAGLCGMVGIMVIEVVLVIIRTNEMENSVAKKKKRNPAATSAFRQPPAPFAHGPTLKLG